MPEMLSVKGILGFSLLRKHDQGNYYKEQHVIEAVLQVQKSSPLSSPRDPSTFASRVPPLPDPGVSILGLSLSLLAYVSYNTPPANPTP